MPETVDRRLCIKPPEALLWEPAATFSRLKLPVIVIGIPLQVTPELEMLPVIVSPFTVPATLSLPLH